MPDLFTLLKKAFSDVVYGIDAASAIKHGIDPVPRPTEPADPFEMRRP